MREIVKEVPVPAFSVLKNRLYQYRPIICKAGSYSIKLIEMNTYSGVLCVFALLWNISPVEALAKGSEGAKMRSWFTSTECQRLSISRFKSDNGQTPTHRLQIRDVKAIHRLMKRINEINPDGDMMKSLLVDEELQLNFECGTAKAQVQIYDGRFKTPSTGFDSSDNDRRLERKIYTDLKTLLNPTIGERILSVENLEIRFSDFSFMFLGKQVREQQPGEPTIGPIWTDHFSIKPNVGAELVLAVTSGQTPPQPKAFQVGGKNFVLYTFLDEKGNRLEPDSLKITSGPIERK